MTLLSRIHANQCTVQGCTRTRAAGLGVCVEDANRLVGKPQPVVEPASKPRWLANLQARDETGRMAA